MSPAALIGRRGTMQQRAAAATTFSDYFATNTIGNYTKPPTSGWTNQTVSYNSAVPSMDGVVGATSRSAYRHSTFQALNADCVMHMKCITAGATRPPQGVMYDPISGMWLRAGFARGSGSVWMEFATMDPATGNEVQLLQPNVNGFTAPTSGPPYWIKITKTGNNVTYAIYNGDPRTGGTLISTATSALTGAGITNLGTGRKVMPGFYLGPQGEQVAGLELA